MKRARDPDQVRQAIAERKLTHRELAKLAECNLGTVTFVLAGKPTNPDTARRIARALRRRVDDLFVAAASTDVQSAVQPSAVA